MIPLPPSTYAHLRILYRYTESKHWTSQVAFCALSLRLQEIIHESIHRFSETSPSLQKRSILVSPPFRPNELPFPWMKEQIQDAVSRLAMNTLEALPLPIQDTLLDEFSLIHGNQRSAFLELGTSMQERVFLCRIRQAKKRKMEEPSASEPIQKEKRILDWLSLFEKYLGDWTLDLLLDMKQWSQCADLMENRKETIRQIHLFLVDRRATALNISYCALKTLPPISVYPFTTRLEHLDASHNNLCYLPTAIKALSQLTTLIISHNPTVYLPQELGYLHQLTRLDVNDYPLWRHVRDLYPEQRSKKAIRQYFFPSAGKEGFGSWLFAPEDGLFCQIKYPRETYSHGRVKVKKVAVCMQSYELVARNVLKIGATPAKDIYRILHINKVLNRLQWTKGVVKKYFDAIVVNPRKVWKIVSYEKNYNLGSLATFLERMLPNEQQKYRITGKVLHASSEMHARSIYHRNLQPEHILLHAEDEALCEIEAALTGLSHCWMAGDFLPDREFYYDSLSVNYTAPEIYALHRQGIWPKKAKLASGDSWALGLILYQLWGNNTPPFGMPFDEGAQQETYLLNISRNLDPLARPAPFAEPQKGLPVWHLIWKLLQFDPKKRISATKACIEFKQIARTELY